MNHFARRHLFLLNNPHPEVELPYSNTRFAPQNSLSSNREWQEGILPCANQSVVFPKRDKLHQFQCTQWCHKDQKWGLVTRTRPQIVPVTTGSLWSCQTPTSAAPVLQKQKQQERVGEAGKAFVEGEEGWSPQLCRAEPQPGIGAFTNGAAWGVINEGSF